MRRSDLDLRLLKVRAKESEDSVKRISSKIEMVRHKLAFL